MLAVGPQLIGINPNAGEVLVEGEVRHLAPQELVFRFDEGQTIDPATLGGIQIVRSGYDGIFGNGNDVTITPGWVGIGEEPSEVVARFASALPDDSYRITILGAGASALKNTAGDPFNDGVNKTVNFELDLGVQIVAVVPQPTGRDAGGLLTQARNEIVVYFSNDDLFATAVTTGQFPTNPTVVDPSFYQLIFTNSTVTNTDDTVFNPTTITYDPVTDRAVLTFGNVSDLASLPTGPGVYRLRIGTNEGFVSPPATLTISADPGDSFGTAYDLGGLGAQSLIVQSLLTPQPYSLDFPGGNDDPGHREVPVQDHLLGGADSDAGIATLYYNFRSDYGVDPQGNPLYNAITPIQMDLARRIFDTYSYYLGVNFVESATRGLTIVTGDLRALDPEADTGPGGIAGMAGGGLAIMDNAENWDDTFGGNWFQVAFHEIGHLLSLGHTYELVPLTIMGDDPALTSGTVEPIFPGDADIIHGQYLFRPEGNDIDVYTFSVAQQGELSAETIAERLANSSTLDTVISLYRQAGSSWELISRNDDYFSEDSFLKMNLTPGTYAISVSAAGDKGLDPTVSGTGLGGRSEGAYHLQLTFRPLEAAHIVDTTGTALDGDGDGSPGGVYNYWFQVQTLAKTKFVDKSAIGGSGADGTLAKPYRTLTEAFAAASYGDVVRLVANGGVDGNLNTLADNLPFLVGLDSQGRTLEDGAIVDVPRGVALMIDAGVIFKSQNGPVDKPQGGALVVGSSSPGVDHSGSSLQVLGTPSMPVYFTSYNDETIGRDTNPSVPQTPAAGDWGGIQFRNDLDRAVAGRVNYENLGIFLNYVNHADMRYGGGQVNIGTQKQVVTPVQMIDARPTITFNTITRSKDAALAANPNSFEETDFYAPFYQSKGAFTPDYSRVGPEIRGNTLLMNTLNGLFIRIATPTTGALQPLTVTARFDDTDIVHILGENLIIQGTPGGPVLNEKTGQLTARLDASLVIDPGTIVKISGANIRVETGAQLIAEGTSAREVILTSLADDTYGAGGTFDTTGDGKQSTPGAGNWGGIYFGHTSTGSIDHAVVQYAGGVTRLKSSSAGFNAVDIEQADVRITNSVFQYCAGGTGGAAPADRFGLLSNEAATIFVRGAQPVIAGNTIRHNAGPAVNVNVNALNSTLVTDFGRSTGEVGLIEGYSDNYGPLVRNNRLQNNGVNGMVVRGATLTTESVWDDTDIVHVLYDEVVVPDVHTLGGLRLVSSSTGSLVVKLSGSQAGFTAQGRPLDIDDRIGGSIVILGQPGRPVVLTSLADDTVGAGLAPDGTLVTDTNNDGNATQPAGGDWRSVRLGEYSNDRNVADYREREAPDLTAPGSNSDPDHAEYVGALAAGEKDANDNLRLGFTIYGVLSQSGDVDVYTFQGIAGTEVWLDIDRTSQSLDTVIELVLGDGTVVARSNNSADEAADPSLLVGGALPMQKLPPFGGKDYFTTNPKDAGLRVVLPGSPGASGLYYVRVRSSSGDLDNLAGGETAGAYQLQIRLREVDEFAGSNIRFADIRYATNGVEVYGQPIHSPLLGEASEDGTANNVFADAQDIGNLLQSDRAAISVAGSLGSGGSDVDFYLLHVQYTALQGPNGDANSDARPVVGTVFDIDYADGLARGNITLSVFDSTGHLVLVASDSNVADDRPVHASGDLDDLSRGSLGPLDSFLGTVELPQGVYYIAVTSNSLIGRELDQFYTTNPANPLLRLEPINSTIRIADDHIESSGGATAAAPIVDPLVDAASVVPYLLGDVVLFVSTDAGVNSSRLYAVNPFTGQVEVAYAGRYTDVGDIALQLTTEFGGNLYSFSQDIEDANPQDAQSGNYLRIDAGTGAAVNLGDDGIATYEVDPANPTGIVTSTTDGVGVQFEAITFGGGWLYAVGFRGDPYESPGRTPLGVSLTRNLLYVFNPATGQVIFDTGNPRSAGAGTDAVERGELLTSTIIRAVAGASIPDGTTFGIDNGTAVTTFEFDSGPAANLDFNLALNQFIRDGWFFELDGHIFEFEVGPVINITGPTFADGTTITIQDDFLPVGRVRTFELDNNDNFNSANVQIKFDAGTSPTQLAADLVAAINNDPANFSVVATHRGGRITLRNDRALDIVPGPSGPSGLAKQGDYGVTTLGNTPIGVEEDSTAQQVRDAIVAAVNGAARPAMSPGVAATITASTSGTRINFSGASTADFSGTIYFFNTLLTSGTATAGAVPVPYLVGDSAAAVASRIAGAINATLGPAITATAGGSSVSVVGAASIPIVSAPLTVAGEGPGGTITGMAFIGDTLYVVSDQGGLWWVENPLGNATAHFIANMTDGIGTGIHFAGLTAGPANAENGAFASMLFGISDTGMLYAFNTGGVLQGVFDGGASSIDTGLNGVQGLAFSSLDVNMWHITSDRRITDAGHGLTVAFDGSRGTTVYDDVNRNLSFYFGRETAGNYDTPGGAHGAIITNPFDLSDYAAQDQPVLYFNYYLNTENVDYNPTTIPTTPMRDAFRVYIGTDDGAWHLLATNDSFRSDNYADEYDSTGIVVQELYDSTGTWRQARISLAAFAGESNLRLRFEFSTAASFNTDPADTDALYGDRFGAYNSELRAQNNTSEGVYIDDLVIGFAERGEMVTNATSNTQFTANPYVPRTDILVGPYQLEVRRASDYGVPVVPANPGDPTLLLTRSFDTNDRLTQAVTLIAPAGAAITSGQSFTLGDGVNQVTFVFQATSPQDVGETGGNLASAVDTGLTGGSSESYSARASIGTPRDVDFFFFDLVAGDTISIDIDARQQGSTLDSYLRVFDSSGNELLFSDDDLAPGETASGANNPNRDSYLEFTALADGRYYVGVSGYPNDAYNPLVSGSGTNSSTTDWYVINFQLNGGQSQPGLVFIPFDYTDTAAQIAKLIVGAINGDVVQALLDLRAASNPNSARIELSGAVTLGAGLAADLREPNSTLSQALVTGIAPGGIDTFLGRGTIGDNTDGFAPGRDVDLISVELTAGETIFIDIDADQLGSSLDSVLRVFDETGAELAFSDDDSAPYEAPSLDSYLSFTAPTSGTYYIGVSGYRNTNYNPMVAGSGRTGSTGFYQIEISREANAVPINVIYHNETGDVNRFRDQGQLIIESSYITDCSQYGIVVDAGARGAADEPHQGPVRVTGKVNTANLAPGVTIVNNVLAFNGTGGIHFSGDTNTATGEVAPIPYGRIINNTIYGVLGSSPAVVDNVTFVTPGPSVLMFGDDSDGTTVPPPGVVPNDDLSSALKDFGFTFEFYGHDYTQFYINNNGNISFEEALWDFTPGGFPASIPMVTPFWADVDTRAYSGGSAAGSVHMITGTTAAGHPFVQIDWIGVGYYDTTYSGNLRYTNTFTLYIEDDPTGDIVAFGYHDMHWTTGDVDSPLENGFGGAGAQIGFDAGDGTHFLSVMRPTSQTDLDALVSTNGGQIVFRIDPNTGQPLVGGGAGIKVDQNASPTILNNIVANLEVGLDIDASSSSSVVAAMLYSNNGVNSQNGALGEDALVLGSSDPLFVNPAARNFYLDIGSKAIDSATDSKEDRPSLVTIRQPLGISASPVQAPYYDVFGLLRTDDGDVPNTGKGERVFLDRGAIERIDGDGPTAALVTPPDGDGDTFVQSTAALRDFVIQLSDVGAGVADTSVTGARVVVTRNGVTLVQGQDYTFRYDATNDQIRLSAGAGVWAPGTYLIVLDNSAATGIEDIANNRLQANQTGGATQFTITLGLGTDWGDAPATYPTAGANAASHSIVANFFLGYNVSADSAGQPSAAADADSYDDGVTFNTPLYLTGESQITVRASQAGKLDAWIDYNRDGIWQDNEKVFNSVSLVAGLNTLNFSPPAGVTPVAGETFARFRFSSAGGLAPGGAASDGEVEDYRVTIQQASWQNPANNLDVNGDGFLSSQDALLLTSFLYFNGQRPVPTGPGAPPFPVAPPPYYDVNGDNYVTSQDALMVITKLRNPTGLGGEGTMAAAESPSSPDAGGPVVLSSMSLADSRGLTEGGSAITSAGTEIAKTDLVVVPEVAPSAEPTSTLAPYLAEMVTATIGFGGSSTIGVGVQQEGTGAATAYTATKLPSVSSEAEGLDASGVDQVMASSIDADALGAVDAGLLEDVSAASSPWNSWETLDDYFAQLDESLELATVSAGGGGWDELFDE